MAVILRLTFLFEAETEKTDGQEVFSSSIKGVAL